MSPVLPEYWSGASSAPTMLLNICKAVSWQGLLSINTTLLLQRFISIWAITVDKVPAQTRLLTPFVTSVSLKQPRPPAAGVGWLSYFSSRLNNPAALSRLGSGHEPLWDDGRWHHFKHSTTVLHEESLEGLMSSFSWREHRGVFVKENKQ